MGARIGGRRAALAWRGQGTLEVGTRSEQDKVGWNGGAEGPRVRNARNAGWLPHICPSSLAWRRSGGDCSSSPRAQPHRVPAIAGSRPH